MLQRPLYNLLKDCTVRIDLSNVHSGTGFFVAPGYILTCDHVVKTAREDPSSITAYYAGGSFPILSLVDFRPEPFPDLALLQTSWQGHPCVAIDPFFDPKSDLYAYGYPEEANEGSPLTLKAVGWEKADSVHEWLKMEQGQVTPGYSGSPVLNLDTGRVCGVLKATRDDRFDLGGWAISIETATSNFPDLAEWNRAFHVQNNRWQQAHENQQGHVEKIKQDRQRDTKIGARQYNTGKIRELLVNTFASDELKLFIFDYFREVEAKLTSGMSRVDVAQELIKYANNRSQLAKLLDAVKQENPSKYQEFEPYFG